MGTRTRSPTEAVRQAPKTKVELEMRATRRINWFAASGPASRLRHRFWP
jgi:hypothetical protein